MAVDNALYLRRRKKIVLSAPSGGGSSLEQAASLSRNLEPYGFALSAEALQACTALSPSQLVALQTEVVAHLESVTGSGKFFRPMYPGFPRQVMETSDARLYLNALVHYATGGKWLPPNQPWKRIPFLNADQPTLIGLGSQEEFDGLFTQLAGSNGSLSVLDRSDLARFIDLYGDDVAQLLPERIPHKENAAILASLFLKRTNFGEPFVRGTLRTATDLLRLAVALNDGDVSLAASTKFGTLTRRHRRLILEMLDGLAEPLEDMLRWKERWKRLGERLHPGEFATRFPRAAAAFAALRNDAPGATFNSRVETALMGHDAAKAIAELTKRPGFFARRLDHLLRLSGTDVDEVLAAFEAAAPSVSTPVLLQVRHHFLVRSEHLPWRVFFPKGMVAKAHAEPNRLPILPVETCARVVALCRAALLKRFAELPPLGKVYVDKSLRDYPIPFAVRSASKALRTIPRGSRLPLPSADTLRFFVWWKNGLYRTDIDLSAVFYRADFSYFGLVSYYDLKNFGGTHSGDIVDAPEGASEFIDVSTTRLAQAGVRYVVMSLSSYTEQPYVDLPECFAGWMARREPESGEVFEPRTLQDRLDLTADSTIAIPLIFDVVARKAIWCDMSLAHDPSWVNNVKGNLRGFGATLWSFANLRKPNLYDLFAIHADARGRRVDSAEEADVIFSVENETPFQLELIGSEFLA